MDGTLARTVFEALVAERMPAQMDYRHHEKMNPADAYSVSVTVGPGRFGSDKLRRVMEIAEEHGTEAHLIGNGLLILPRV